LDATIIRTLLAPALMRLAGDANWWRPAILNPFYQRFKLREHDTQHLTTGLTAGAAGAGIAAGETVAAGTTGHDSG
jgi:RND superfamily putative drug exporter